MLTRRSFQTGLLLAASGSLVSSPGAAQQAVIRGLDHIPLAVKDLERSKADFEALGFALKPGRPHENGLRNAHVKFPDGTVIELITVAAATDALTSEYHRWLEGGDGPAFVGLYAPDFRALTRRVAGQPAAAQGQFKGKLVAELLKDGRNLKLLQPFAYIDAKGQVWDVPAAFETDGASVPRIFWSLYAPFTGKYREAAVIHDRFCRTKSRSWQDTHNVFYEAMLASGVDARTAKVMWAAVYNFGDRWGKGVKRRALPATVEEEQEFMRDLDAWVECADPSTGEIAKAVDQGRIPR